MSALQRKLKEKMQELNLSAYTLEKRAGLRPSAVQNIIYGRSKNPSFNLLKSIAQVLGCNVEDLVDQNYTHKSSNDVSVKANKRDVKKEKWDQELYFRCFKQIHDIITHKNTNIKKEKIIEIIDEVYTYSVENGLNTPDIRFINWLIAKYC
jgi:transcriptional regulator with XRE-family HTH domain